MSRNLYKRVLMQLMCNVKAKVSDQFLMCQFSSDL